MEIRILDSKQEMKIWDAYVLKNINTAFYHLSGWKEIIEKSFGCQAMYLLAKNDDIKGILPLFYLKSLFGSHFVSLPFVNYGGVYADDAQTENLLIEEAIRLTKKYKANYLELRHIKPKDNPSLYTRTHKQTFILDLCDDYSCLWDDFTDKMRNQIRKAQKAGLEVKSGDKELLDSFYFVYSRRMKELGTPVIGKFFFQNICLKFPENIKIFITYHKNALIGGALALSFKETLEVPWASSLSKYFSYCPNNLMYWEIIKYSCQNKFKYFDFGRSTKDSSHAVFKTNWGANSVDLSWQYYFNSVNKLPDVNQDNLKFYLASNIWKILPLSLANYLGPKIAKHLPY